jgi:co-chaperonin GroES (HSP10)
MNLYPTPGNLVVEKLPEEERTESGLILVGSQDRSAYAVRVLEVNPPKDEDEPENYFQKGQKLIIGKWQGTELTIGVGLKRKTVLIINESSVLATVREDDGEQQGSST